MLTLGINTSIQIRLMVQIRKIEGIHFIGDSICLTVDDKFYQIELNEISKKLAQADNMKRMMFVLSPSGYGIHWPLLDEDISIEGLLKMKS